MKNVPDAVRTAVWEVPALIDYRIVFEKTGKARFISHLDLNRTMQRVIRRSGLPAWYTQGFHPHMYLMFAIALSLGAESRCEVMDMRLTQELPFDEVKNRLNAALPEGIHVVDVRKPVHGAVEMGSALYTVLLETENSDLLAAQWEGFLAQEEIPYEKKTKHKTRQLNIRPMIQVEEMAAEDGMLRLMLRLPAGNEGNLNVTVVTGEFEKYAEQAFFVKQIMREKIFCQNGEKFF